MLRPLIEDVRTAEGAFIKKKVWDGVTGTIFNLPTKPLEPNPNREDEKLHLTKRAYADPIGDKMWNDGNVFPLDIRRVKRVLPKDKVKTDTPLMRDGEICFSERYSIGKRERKPAGKNENSPWWLTFVQRFLRDVPPRVHPPAKEDYKPYYLEVDDTCWKEEVEKDENFQARYFVTNLHGGTLVINGMEVKKGCVAGPLPSFAVIESPGGQVSFWWGNGGRHHKAGTEPVAHSLSWKLLREREGWQYTGMRAGEVWNMKLKARFKVESKGNEDEEDEQWAAWKKGEHYPPQRVPLSVLKSKSLLLQYDMIKLTLDSQTSSDVTAGRPRTHASNRT